MCAAVASSGDPPKTRDVGATMQKAPPRHAWWGFAVDLAAQGEEQTSGVLRCLLLLVLGLVLPIRDASSRDDDAYGPRAFCASF